MLSSISDGTRAAYDSGFEAFRSFLLYYSFACDLSNLPNISEDVLVYFVTYCFRRLNLSPSTIKLYLCGIRFKYVQSGHHNPLESIDGKPLERLKLICNAMKREAGKPIPTRLPITFNILCNMCTRLDAGVFCKYVDLVMKTACIVAFFGFLRCGEITVRSTFDPAINLCIGDVSISDSCAVLTLKSSKTDPFRRGVSIQLHETGHAVCPVSALREYLYLRSGISSNTMDPLFVLPNGKPLTRCYFIEQLRTVLSLIGQPSHSFNGHSFRIGAATTAGSANVDDHLIQTLGRWSSDCYTRYIRTSPADVRKAQRSLTL